MADQRLSYDYAIHSDYLIHWTAKDIDKDHDPGWSLQHNCRTTPDVTERYTARLRDIVTHGLWMTEEPARTIKCGVTFPATPVCCFTELKLSLSRRHARQFVDLRSAKSRRADDLRKSQHSHRGAAQLATYMFMMTC